jgi:hypothetical protein
MPKTLRERLVEKGWAEDEIKKTESMVYGEGKQEKHIGFKEEMNKIVYWTTLLVLTIANFLISLVLIPFLLVMKPYQLGIIVGLLGFMFGLMFNLIVRDIEHIETKHHVAAAVFIPTLALINMFVMVSISNNLSTRLSLQIHENPWLISVIYVAAFLVPYIYSELIEAKNRMRRLEVKR